MLLIDPADGAKNRTSSSVERFERRTMGLNSHLERQELPVFSGLSDKSSDNSE